MSLSEACDDLLSLGILQHEYGIPKLWPHTAPQVQKPDLETEYYALNQQLASVVNRLVFVNKMVELRQTDAQSVGEEFAENLSSEVFQNMSFTEKESHLRGMARFKLEELTSDFLTAALPVLRSIHQENSTLTDSEFTILNNLKKLYSHYNEHHANIRRLLAEYTTQKSGLNMELELHSQIQQILSEKLTPALEELDTLNNEYLVLQNTYENRLSARETDALALALRKLKQALYTLSRRISRLSALCELLPNLVLCQASNWYSDKALLAVVEECQDLGETLEGFPETENLRLVDEVLKTDLETLEL